MSSFNNPSNLDPILLQTLMGRLQLRPPQTPFPSQTLENLLFDQTLLSSDDDDEEYDTSSKTHLAKEESALEKEIIRVILTGNTDSLKPNSGQAVTINEHHICIGFHEEEGSEYRVWEWHGHVMLLDDENGYMPEYIYGNYFERLRTRVGAKSVKEEREEKEERVSNLGLKELIEAGDSGSGGSGGVRVLHRNVNTGASPRFI